jgi:hypothetical protein
MREKGVEVELLAVASSGRAGNKMAGNSWLF